MANMNNTGTPLDTNYSSSGRLPCYKPDLFEEVIALVARKGCMVQILHSLKMFCHRAAVLYTRLFLCFLKRLCFAYFLT